MGQTNRHADVLAEWKIPCINMEGSVNEEQSKPTTAVVSPESFLVFIVGINGEWEQGRRECGDIALYNQYLAAGVPEHHIVFVKDDKATKQGCESALINLLQTSTSDATFVFYYGGHGHVSGFDTYQDEWKYKDLVENIRLHFRGKRVVILADCCGSGNFRQSLERLDKPLIHSYLCLMSTAPYTEAGPEWTMTETWMRSMRCNDGTLQIGRVIDYMSDEIARIKGDLLTVYTVGDVNMTCCSWLPIRVLLPNPSSSPRKRIEDYLTWKMLKKNIPLDRRVTTKNWSIGDIVFYKSELNKSALSLSCIPVWRRATILSIPRHNALTLKVFDIMDEMSSPPAEWTVKVDRRELINDLYMASMFMIPDGLGQVQCDLARRFIYLTAVLPQNKHVQVLERDRDIYYPAIVVDWKDVNWKEVMKTESYISLSTKGPHVTLCRQENSTIVDIVPLENISGFEKSTRSSPTSNDLPNNQQVDGIATFQKQPNDIMMLSIKSCSKQVCDATSIFGTKRLSCFWPEDREWYDAEALNPTNVSLEVLSTHSLFTLHGRYCPVHYEDDTTYLIPLHYIRKRKICPLSCVSR